MGYVAKGSYFEVRGETEIECYNIYKEPITDDGTKKSLKGLVQVYRPNGAHGSGEIIVKEQCTWEEEGEGLLQTIYENGKFFNQTTLSEIRERIKKEIEFDIKYKL